MRPQIILTVGVLLSTFVGTNASAACGEKGGPGYRGPNGKCVGWAEMGRVCGSPPTARCSPEMTAAGAEDAADHGAKIEQLRPPPTRK